MKCNIYSYSLICYIIILTLLIYYANHFNIKTVCVHYCAPTTGLYICPYFPSYVRDINFPALLG